MKWTESVRKSWDIWALLVPLLAMLPLLILHWRWVLMWPERQFAPLLLLLVAALAARARYAQFQQNRQLPEPPPVPLGRWRLAMTLFFVGLALFAVSVLRFSPWLTQLAVTLVFAAWAVGGLTGVRLHTIGAWLLLLLITLPLPLGLDQQLIAGLQAYSAWAASSALDTLAVPHLRTANLIEVRGSQLFVEEACSGVTSPYALLATAAVLLYVNSRSLLVSILALLAVPVWAAVGMFLRILVVCLAFEWWARDLSTGWDHALLGIAAFGVSVLGYWITQWLLVMLLAPVPPTEPEFEFMFRSVNSVFSWPNPDPLAESQDGDPDENLQARRVRELLQELAAERQANRKLVRWQEELPWVRVVQASGILAVLLTLPIAATLASSFQSVTRVGLPSFNQQDLKSFPGAALTAIQSPGWKLQEFGQQTRSSASHFGEHSLLWRYTGPGGVSALLSLDFPFRGWHGLEARYRSIGWTVRTIDFKGEDSEEQWPWVEFDMQDKLGGEGFVCYAHFTETGGPFGRNTLVSEEGLVLRRLLGVITGSQDVVAPVTYQIQVFCDNAPALDEETRQRIRAVFLEAREAFRRMKTEQGWDLNFTVTEDVRTESDE
jgi:exosortase